MHFTGISMHFTSKLFVNFMQHMYQNKEVSSLIYYIVNHLFYFILNIYERSNIHLFSLFTDEFMVSFSRKECMKLTVFFKGLHSI